jgi:hypothetical protein
MNRRDQKLLDKQFRWARPAPRHEGVMILAIVAVFFAGITVGGTLSAHENTAPQTVTQTQPFTQTTSAEVTPS